MMAHDEIGWLVEFPPIGDRYENGARVGPACGTEWVAAIPKPYGRQSTRTKDANLALRFARKDDAEALIKTWLNDRWGSGNRAFASEHIWHSMPEAALTTKDDGDAEFDHACQQEEDERLDEDALHIEAALTDHTTKDDLTEQGEG